MSRIEQSLEKATAMRQGRKEIDMSRKDLPNKGFRSKIMEIHADNQYLVTIKDPKSIISEEYKILKSVVKRLTSQDGFNNVIMITSAGGNEGKSLTALNLAISLAQEYDTTALVMDADLRKPSLSSYLNIGLRKGWTDYLKDNVDLHSVMIRTNIGNLRYLPAGRSLANPVECFSSEKMKDLINELKHHYSDRYIIIDAPPVLPFAETRLIGRMADAVIFVVSEGSSTLEDVEESVEALKDANILGIVYNKSHSVRTKGYARSYYTRNIGENGKREKGA
jgi:protein-tyrosine kinase